MNELAAARAWLEHHKESGVRCPCCGQFAKVYTRKLNSAMARDLIWLVKTFKEIGYGWVDVSTTGPIELQRSRELAKLVHWGLVECKTGGSNRGARTSGVRRPTWQGIMFAENAIALPKYVQIYDGKFISYCLDKGETNIREALGDHFDFYELWVTRS